ncbi:MAG: alpha/beta fold hydrolase [Candidatus Rokubacteria bacterium]|nr:alpha/beta fold hydrolase [Candidatus Rokubacteria bacterium]
MGTSATSSAAADARPAATAVDGAFRPAWWCRNPHLQTLWGPLLRWGHLPLRRERVATRDGDFVDLDWADGRPGAPLLLVLHGLEGSARSHYVTGLLREGLARGWRGVALNFRSCSGEPNRLPRFYHSGDTGDLDAVIERLVDREPTVRMGAAGVSLGGNVLLKWLGERGAGAPRQLAAAVGISVPFDLAACARVLDRGFCRAVYTANFMRTLRRKVVEKARAYPGFVDLARVRRARSFAAYDRTVTAPLHGFADEVDYWTRSSSGPYLARLRRPTLLINARDDPFVPPGTLPDPATLPAGVAAEFLPRGGHAGFLDGPPWRVGSWAERRAVEFLQAALTGA